MKEFTISNYDHYNQFNGSYFLLPFRFKRIDIKNELLVNEVGDYLIVDAGTVEKIVNKKIKKNIDTTLYQDLLSNFFISEKPIPNNLELLETRYRTKKSFLDNFTSLHILVMTLRCNNNCQYCQVSRIENKLDSYDISINALKLSIDLIMQSPNPNLTLEFQGGEPLLVFDKIKFAVEYSTTLGIQKNKNIQFVICTNLSLISEEILDFCRENKILISTSLDGPEKLHNLNRQSLKRNNYKTTIEAINLCRDRLGHDKVSALMTTSKESLKYPREIVREYFDQGFTNIFLRPINPYGFALNNKSQMYHAKDFILFYKTALDEILKINLQGKLFIEDYTKIILDKILTPFPIFFVDLLSPSGIINNVVVYNYDGNVYASDESRMLAEMGDDYFYLGNVFKDSYHKIFYGNKARQLSNFWANEWIPGCSDCVYQVYCGADPVKNYSTQGDVVGFRPTNSFCYKNKNIIDHIFKLLSVTEIENVFIKWISDI